MLTQQRLDRLVRHYGGVHHRIYGDIHALLNEMDRQASFDSRGGTHRAIHGTVPNNSVGARLTLHERHCSNRAWIPDFFHLGRVSDKTYDKMCVRGGGL